MSGPTLTTLAQYQYLVQWFGEWSELQRQDFLPILAGKVVSNGLYVNGLVDSMNAVNCQDKPMSLFQCRVKLFNEWTTNWTPEDKNKLVMKLSEIDESFGAKLHEELSGNKQVVDDHKVVAESETLQNDPSHDAEVENREVIEEDKGLAINETPMPIQIAE